MNVSWMITTIPLLGRARRSLYVIFFIGFVAELAVLCLGDDTTLADGGVNVVELIRIYTRVAAFIACIIAFLMACICPKKEATAEITMDELMKRQMEIVAMLSAAQQVDSNVGTPTFSRSPLTVTGPVTVEQSHYNANREDDREDSFIITNPNFKPSRRQRKSSHYQPYHKPLRACESPVLVSKRSSAAEPMIRVNTVTPNTRVLAQNEWENAHAIVSRQEVQHIHQLQSNAESSSDSSDSSSDEDEHSQLVMTKKKRKHSELQMSDSEQDDLPHNKHESKVNETKKKKSKLEGIKIY